MKSQISTEDLHQQAQLYLAQAKLEEPMAAYKQTLEIKMRFTENQEMFERKKDY